MKQTILILSFLIIASILKAQLFYDKAIYPNTTSVKGKYFNGSGGTGYWSLEKLIHLEELLKEVHIERQNY